MASSVKAEEKGKQTRRNESKEMAERGGKKYHAEITSEGRKKRRVQSVITEVQNPRPSVYDA